MAKDTDKLKEPHMTIICLSEIFWTTDKDFGFQRVGNTWNLYERENGWYFTKDFRSFWQMQQYIRERREGTNDGNRLESESSQEV